MREILSVVLAALAVVGWSGPAGAGAIGGTVQFNGRVDATPVPGCVYDAASLSVPMAPIDFDKVPLVSANVTAMAAVGMAPGGIVSNGQAVRNAITGTSAVSGGYGSASMQILCRNLSAPFAVRTGAAANNGATSACNAVGCSYLKVHPADADVTMANSLALAMFIFAPLPGQSTIGAGWVDLSKTWGFAAGGLSSDGAYPVLGRAETANVDIDAWRTLEFGFLLVRNADLTDWANSKDTRSQNYTGAIEMSLVYQ